MWNPKDIKQPDILSEHFQAGLRRGAILPRSTPSVATVYKDPLTPAETGYGYTGVVSTNEEQTHLQCHLCGYFFANLAGHISKGHDLRTSEYRRQFEIAQNTALMNEDYRRRMQDRWFALPDGKRQVELEKLKRYSQDVEIGARREWHNNPYSLERRNRLGLCPDQVLETIPKLAEKLGRVPTFDEFQAEYRGRYMSSLKYYFGKYTTAVKAAGLMPKGYVQRSSDQLLDSIILFRQANGREPLYSDFKRGKLAANVNTYWEHFGGIVEARHLATKRGLRTEAWV